MRGFLSLSDVPVRYVRWKSLGATAVRGWFLTKEGICTLLIWSYAVEPHIQTKTSSNPVFRVCRPVLMMHSWLLVALCSSPSFLLNYHKHHLLAMAGVWLQTPVIWLQSPVVCLQRWATVLMQWHVMNSMPTATDSRSGFASSRGDGCLAS